MWVLVGGIGTLVGPMLGCVALLFVTFALGTTQVVNTYFVYGMIVMVFVLVIPQGIVPTVRDWRDHLEDIPGRLARACYELHVYSRLAARVHCTGSEMRCLILIRRLLALRQHSLNVSVFLAMLMRSRPFRSSAAPILQCRALTMRFGGVVAVNSVDFSLNEGELRCLIGPNGASKSTFFKCLTRQYEPTAGHVYFRGEEITKRNTHQIAQYGIGIKTQVPSLFDRLSVRENIWLAARRRHGNRVSNRIVGEILERLSLTESEKQLVGRLAHGERQWVELATVLSGNPVLVLLDEPTAGMSHDEVLRTAELIREINRTTSLIVVEHDMQFIKSIAQKVTVFHRGQILVEDTMINLLNNQQVQDIYLGKGLV